MAIAIERKCALAEEIENLCSRCDSGRKWPQRSGRKKETLGDIQEEFVVVPTLLRRGVFFFLPFFFFFYFHAEVEIWLKVTSQNEQINAKSLLSVCIYLALYCYFSIELNHFITFDRNKIIKITFHRVKREKCYRILSILFSRKLS